MFEGVVHAYQLIAFPQQFRLLQGSSNSEDKRTNNDHLEITINFYKILANHMLFVVIQDE